MHRLTTDRVNRAFYAMRYRPSRVVWLDRGERLADALALLLEQKTPGVDYDGKKRDPHYVGQVLQLEGFYVLGFMWGWSRGWDGREIDHRVNNNFTPTKWEARVQGWWDGACAASAFGLADYEAEALGINQRYVESLKHRGRDENRRIAA